MEIRDLMVDEVQAVEGYNQFLKEHLKELSTASIKKIHKIIKDEKRHWRILNRMKLNN